MSLDWNIDVCLSTAVPSEQSQQLITRSDAETELSDGEPFVLRFTECVVHVRCEMLHLVFL